MSAEIYGLNLIKAKTCNGCKASEYSTQPLIYYCRLQGFNCSSKGVPSGPCPKPKTNNDYVDFSLHIQRSRQAAGR